MPSSTKRNSKNYNSFLPRSHSSVHPSNYHSNVNHTPVTQTVSLSHSRCPSQTFSTKINSFSDGNQLPPSSLRNINPYTTSSPTQTPERAHSSHDPNTRTMTMTHAPYLPPTQSHPRSHPHYQYSNDSSITSSNILSTYHEIDSSPRQRNERVLFHKSGRVGSHTSDMSIGSISSIDSVRSMGSTRTTGTSVDTRPLPSTTETKYWNLSAKAGPGWERF